MFSTCQKDIFNKQIPKNYLKTLLFISAIKRALKQVNFFNFVNQKRAVTSFYVLLSDYLLFLMFTNIY